MTDAKTLIEKKHGKKYNEKVALLGKKKYPIDEAVALLTKVSTSSFDSTAELHIRIGADTTQADQLVRTTVSLPHGTGKKVRIAAFVPDDMVDAAKKAGATKAGSEDLIKEVAAEKIDFDIAVAHPNLMKDLGKVAKILGQRGMMPNPKSGTVTKDIVKTINELNKGRIECKMDKQAIIHTIFGKLSFGEEKLKENLEVILKSIKEAKPAGIKGNYILSATIAPSMGPGIKIEV
ncbi:50S ribosomal protein L1 [Patescibacteria group bacterium]|nr:50S ribosomal protein L1 [Patescibacteria group bacterium]MBU1123814.1 50S ribosomal protein L1 [Patescibacteria group bacterium]